MKNFISRVFSKLKRLRYGQRLNPARDWSVLVALSAAILVCIIVYSLCMFDTIANGGTVGTTATSTAPIFDQSSLDSIRAVFANRAAEKTKYENGVYHFADPSQ